MSLLCGTQSIYSSLVYPLQSSLSFPSDVDVSSDARDLIIKLLRDSKDRIGFEGIRSHPFFALVRWDHLLDSMYSISPYFLTPPYGICH